MPSDSNATVQSVPSAANEYSNQEASNMLPLLGIVWYILCVLQKTADLKFVKNPLTTAMLVIILLVPDLT